MRSKIEILFTAVAPTALNISYHRLSAGDPFHMNGAVMGSFSDKELGMGGKIARRDFINGAAMSIGATLLGGGSLFAQSSTPAGENKSSYYPPATTGLRGCHKGAYETAHSLRDGTFWKSAGAPTETGEKYDLIVVGSGISGLSAARFYRQAAGPSAKILILENHDDFGGHAKRNEFTADGQMLLGYGGSATIHSPGAYSSVAKKLVDDLGVDVSGYSKFADTSLFPSLGLGQSVFFDQETFGSDALTADVEAVERIGTSEQRASAWKRFMSEAPLGGQAKSDLQRLYALKDDLLAGQSDSKKKLHLAQTSYSDYLTGDAKMDPQVVAYLQARTHKLYGVGIDAVPAQDAWKLGYPGFDGLKLTPEAGPGLGRAAKIDAGAQDYTFHFPDGNASVARLLVRNLIPEAVSDGPATDILTSAVHYDRLDQPKNNVRIRLSSTVVRVKHSGDLATAKEVEVFYVTNGKIFRATAAHCILACWNTVIPYLSEEFSPKQRDALVATEKVPAIQVNVALQNWKPFVKAGTWQVHCPGAYFSSIALDHRVSMGSYKATKSPDDPIVATLFRSPCSPGLPARSQHRAGRAEIYNAEFDGYERNVRDQLTRILSAGGFDPAKDIAAITVNRWGHGGCYQYNSLWDSFWIPGGPLPCEEARKPLGRVAIANADSDAYPYMNASIDQAYRAVGDLKL